MSYKAASSSIANPVDQQQIDASRGRAEQGLNLQDAFIQALTQHANPALGAQGSLNDMLLNQAMGGGPNPAQDAFTQNTGQIAAQQAGSIASQKGISPALAARMISMQGGQAQQNAAASAAQMRGNQALQAQQLLSQNAGNQVQQALAGQGAYTQAAQNQQNSLLNALQGYNTNAVAATGNMNSANSAVQQQVAKSQGSLLNSAGAAIGMAHGGQVSRYSGGGPVSGFGKHVMNLKSGGSVPGRAMMSGDNKQNDVVPAMLSPGEIVIPRSITAGKDASKKAAEFVAAIMARKK